VGFLSSAIAAVGGYEDTGVALGARGRDRGKRIGRVPEGWLVICYEQRAPKTMLEGCERGRERWGTWCRGSSSGIVEQCGADCNKGESRGAALRSQTGDWRVQWWWQW
jgi:hypothetical protein